MFNPVSHFHSWSETRFYSVSCKSCRSSEFKSEISLFPGDTDGVRYPCDLVLLAIEYVVYVCSVFFVCGWLFCSIGDSIVEALFIVMFTWSLVGVWFLGVLLYCWYDRDNVGLFSLDAFSFYFYCLCFVFVVGLACFPCFLCSPKRLSECLIWRRLNLLPFFSPPLCRFLMLTCMSEN